MKSHDKAEADVAKPPRESIKDKVKDDSVSCSLCKLESKNLDSLRTHIENVHVKEVTNQETPNCEEIESQTNETCTKCPHCTFICNVRVMDEHIKNKYGSIASCGECSKTFSDVGSRKKHMEISCVIHTPLRLQTQ